MATKSSDKAVLQDFPQFQELPIEIRRTIWEFALPIFHSPQFIPLSVSDPSQPLTEGDHRNGSLAPSRHLFFSAGSPVPLLLHTCSESRQAAKVFYTQSWATRADGWGCLPTTDTPPEPTRCDISKEFDEISEHMYWKPETDVVLVKHGYEPYACKTTAICNAENPSYGLWFDKRIRFLAMPRNVFERGIREDDELRIPNLEIVFVLMAKPPKTSLLREIGITDRLVESRFSRWKNQKQQEWSDPRVLAKIFPCKDRKENMERIVVKIVTSLDEILQIVDKWPRRAPQGSGYGVPRPS